MTISFEEACERFARAAERLREEEKKRTSEYPERDIVTRRVINRLVKILADQRGIDVHTMWVRAYHDHHKRTGYYAILRSGGKGVHLDAVQRDGQLTAFQETLEGLLKENYERR